jgi:hypothetical protein
MCVKFSDLIRRLNLPYTGAIKKEIMASAPPFGKYLLAAEFTELRERRTRNEERGTFRVCCERQLLFLAGTPKGKYPLSIAGLSPSMALPVVKLFSSR